jgi:phosphate:Na+ symporter
MTVAVLGGIGVFMVGMVLLTEGLKSVAGATLRRLLMRFTGSTTSAIATGTIATALVQSSSATTMTTIGLVAAGLLPLANAVGVILGANLGTTSTAWIVAYFGLKLDIGAVAMVAVALGAVLRLVGRGPLALAGLPLAGFGLLFVGIGLMQTAMAGVAGAIALPAASSGFADLLLLVAVGAAMTVVMQSSSAAVATTLTALSAGVIGADQAVALVIGQNVGTTPTALLASVGAVAAARRAAAAHLVFNLGTAVVALAALPLLVGVATAVTGGVDAADPAIVVALFHTLFNLLGVALVLPWLGGFTALVSRMAPERSPRFTQYLETAAQDGPTAAVLAARTTLLMASTELGDVTHRLVTHAARGRAAQGARLRLQHVQHALEETAAFLAKLPEEGDASDAVERRYVSVLHALGHLRDAAELLGRGKGTLVLAREAALADVRTALASGIDAMMAWCPVLAPDAPATEALEALAHVQTQRRHAKALIVRTVVHGRRDPYEIDDALAALAWVGGFAHHLERAVHHLREPAPGDGL